MLVGFSVVFSHCRGLTCIKRTFNLSSSPNVFVLMSTMISAVLRREARPLAVSRSPAVEWPLAGSPCPRAVGLQSVGYARGLLQRRSKVSRQIRPLEWTVTSPVCSGGPGPVQSKTNIRSPQEPCLWGQTLQCPTWWGDVCRTDGTAVTWRRWAGPDMQRAEQP